MDTAPSLVAEQEANGPPAAEPAADPTAPTQTSLTQFEDLLNAATADSADAALSDEDVAANDLQRAEMLAAIKCQAAPPPAKPEQGVAGEQPDALKQRCAQVSDAATRLWNMAVKLKRVGDERFERLELELRFVSLQFHRSFLLAKPGESIAGFLTRCAEMSELWMDLVYKTDRDDDMDVDDEDAALSAKQALIESLALHETVMSQNGKSDTLEGFANILLAKSRNAFERCDYADSRGTIELAREKIEAMQMGNVCPQAAPTTTRSPGTRLSDCLCLITGRCTRGALVRIRAAPAHGRHRRSGCDLLAPGKQRRARKAPAERRPH